MTPNLPLLLPVGIHIDWLIDILKGSRTFTADVRDYKYLQKELGLNEKSQRKVCVLEAVCFENLIIFTRFSICITKEFSLTVHCAGGLHGWDLRGRYFWRKCEFVTYCTNRYKKKKSWFNSKKYLQSVFLTTYVVPGSLVSLQTYHLWSLYRFEQVEVWRRL